MAGATGHGGRIGRTDTVAGAAGVADRLPDGRQDQAGAGWVTATILASGRRLEIKLSVFSMCNWMLDIIKQSNAIWIIVLILEVYDELVVNRKGKALSLYVSLYHTHVPTQKHIRATHRTQPHLYTNTYRELHAPKSSRRKTFSNLPTEMGKAPPAAKFLLENSDPKILSPKDTDICTPVQNSNT